MVSRFHVCLDERNKAISWAKDILKREDVVILDTETTGIEITDEVIEVGVVNLTGEVVFFSRLNPKKHRMSNGAKRAHKISIQELRGEPAYKEVHQKLKDALDGKLVLIYNASFDIGMIEQTYLIHMGQICSFEDAFGAEPSCLMLAYAQFCGLWNSKVRWYRWRKLPGATHGAIADCRAALELLKTMATASPVLEVELQKQKFEGERRIKKNSFVAISTESSTLDATNICSLGICVAKNCKIVERKKWFFSLPEMIFDERSLRKFKKIGLEKKDFVDKPSFTQAWSQIRPYIDGKLVLSHQDFPDDLLLLREKYDMEYGEFNFVYFKKLMRRAFPGRKSYGLTKLAREFGYDLSFHDTESDSYVTAQLVIEALLEYRADSIGALCPPVLAGTSDPG